MEADGLNHYKVKQWKKTDDRLVFSYRTIKGDFLLKGLANYGGVVILEPLGTQINIYRLNEDQIEDWAKYAWEHLDPIGSNLDFDKNWLDWTPNNMVDCRRIQDMVLKLAELKVNFKQIVVLTNCKEIGDLKVKIYRVNN